MEKVFGSSEIVGIFQNSVLEIKSSIWNVNQMMKTTNLDRFGIKMLYSQLYNHMRNYVFRMYLVFSENVK